VLSLHLLRFLDLQLRRVTKEVCRIGRIKTCIRLRKVATVGTALPGLTIVACETSRKERTSQQCSIGPLSQSCAVVQTRATSGSQQGKSARRIPACYPAPTSNALLPVKPSRSCKHSFAPRTCVFTNNIPLGDCQTSTVVVQAGETRLSLTICR
jgi:hypothetical protein